MKKILIISRSLRIGGIERSLINLLSSIDYNSFEVDLFLYSNTGEYLNHLPSEVNLINKSKVLNILGMTMKETNLNFGYKERVLRILSSLICLFIGSNLFWTTVFKNVKINKTYDVAIAYSNNTNYRSLNSGYYQLLVKNVTANKKIGWIHTDYKEMGLNKDKDNQYFEQLDAIVNVSKAGKQVFDKIFPQHLSKSFVVYNTIPVEEIEKLSNKDIIKNNNKSHHISGVTVARLDKNKSVYRVITAVNEMSKMNIKVYWTIVGDGPEKKRLEKISNELGLRDQIQFVGNKRNPYPYIKQADLLVQCSKFEGMPMTVLEALALKTPVLVTNYASAGEQVLNGINGMIVENSDEGITEGLKKFVLAPNTLREMEQNIKDDDQLTKLALVQFYNLISNK